MVAHLLHECGVYLGPEEALMSASPENPDGYWENKRIVALNDSLLDTLGGAWDAPPSEVQPEKLLQEYGQQAQAQGSELQERALWGWKDPRVCLTLPFWQAVFPQIRLVVCVRSPIEVARSLNHRQDTIGYDHGLELWCAYYDSLLRYLRPTDRVIFTHYDTWFYDPTRELQRVTSEMKLSIPAETLEAASQIVSGKLRHSLSTPELLRASPLPTNAEQLYATLLEKLGTVFEDMQADAANQQGIADNMKNTLLEELIATERKLSENRWELKTTTASLSNMHHEVHKLQIEVAEREHETALLNEELAHCKALLAEREQVLAMREQQLADVRNSRAYQLYARLLKPAVKKKS